MIIDNINRRSSFFFFFLKLLTTMNKLRTEVLIPIFSQLSINDKLECILVCKKWYIIMAENSLYMQLSFSNVNNFNKALDLFDKKQKFGCYVESLTISPSCEIDTVSIFLMPRQFPNLKHLNWKEDIRPTEERLEYDISIKNLPPSSVCQRELKKWNLLQTIDIGLKRLPFMKTLLESSPLDYLTYLSF